jgi:hypothetical protein
MASFGNGTSDAPASPAKRVKTVPITEFCTAIANEGVALASAHRALFVDQDTNGEWHTLRPVAARYAAEDGSFDVTAEFQLPGIDAGINLPITDLVIRGDHRNIYGAFIATDKQTMWVLIKGVTTMSSISVDIVNPVTGESVPRTVVVSSSGVQIE